MMVKEPIKCEIDVITLWVRLERKTLQFTTNFKDRSESYKYSYFPTNIIDAKNCNDG